MSLHWLRCLRRRRAGPNEARGPGQWPRQAVPGPVSGSGTVGPLWGRRYPVGGDGTVGPRRQSQRRSCLWMGQAPERRQKWSPEADNRHPRCLEGRVEDSTFTGPSEDSEHPGGYCRWAGQGCHGDRNCRGGGLSRPTAQLACGLSGGSCGGVPGFIPIREKQSLIT